MRKKPCDVCSKDCLTMYRVIHKEGADWVFVRKQCLLSIKKKNPHYKFESNWSR